MSYPNEKEFGNEATRINFFIEKTLTLTIIAMFVGLILVKHNPLDHLPGRDSGSFLYAGDQILQGNLPYRDFWDSKGPGIFYINALGLWLGKNTRWGVWLLEFLFLTTSSFLVHDGISRKWSKGAALFANILWLYGFMQVSQGGNLTEEYPLLFNFWALAYFFKTDGVPSKKLSFLIGFTLALSFLFRANNIGVQVSLLLSLLFMGIYQRQTFRFIKVIIASFLGAFLPLALVSMYFLYKGLFGRMFDAAIFYNFYYSNNNLGNLNLKNGLLNIGWPAFIALFGYGILLIQLLHPKKKAHLNSICFFLLISFPVEIVFSNISGRGYPHYFISWMPSIAALGAFVYYRFSSEIFSTKFKNTLENPYRTLKYILPILLIIYWYTGTFADYQRITQRLLFERGSGIEKVDPVANFIRNNTEKDESIYVWGARPDINFLSRRSSPTAYIFYPLYVKSPFTERMSLELYNDIITNKPTYIIDTSSSASFEILSLDPRLRQNDIKNVSNELYAPPYQDSVLIFIDANYQRINTINQYDIYVLTTP